MSWFSQFDNVFVLCGYLKYRMYTAYATVSNMGATSLSHGAMGGVYLSGGLTSKLEPWIIGDEFIERFSAHHKMRAFLENTPVFRINQEFPALLGASHWSMAV